MKKIAFLMRYDYEKISGGDVLQVNSYIPYLEAEGYHCSLVNDLNSKNIHLFDIFILVNVDRPIETVNYFNKIKKHALDKKLYLIPIHHPVEAVSLFEKQAREMVYRIICRFFPDFYSREKVKNFVRAVKNPKFLSLAIKDMTLNYRAALKSIFESADGVIFISNGERLSVENDFMCTPKKYCIAYNAVENDLNIGREEEARDIDVIIVGRIEPRKNQLIVAKTLSKMGVKAVFIGPVNNNQDYSDAFISVVERSNNIEYLGAMEHSDVLRYFKKSKVLLNASFFEVNPLVDLEAALLNCGVVTTKYSYTQESLPNAIEIDPWLEESIRKAVLEALEDPTATILNKNINSSWGLSAKAILGLISND